MTRSNSESVDGGDSILSLGTSTGRIDGAFGFDGSDDDSDDDDFDDSDEDTEPLNAAPRLSRSLQEILWSDRIADAPQLEEQVDLLRVEDTEQWGQHVDQLLESIPDGTSPTTAIYVLATALEKVATRLGKELGQSKAKAIGGLALPALFTQLSLREADEVFVVGSDIVYHTIGKLDRQQPRRDPLDELLSLLGFKGVAK